MSTEAAQRNNPSPQPDHIKKLFQDFRPYDKYLRELYETLKDINLLSEKSQEELNNLTEQIIIALSRDINPKKFGRIAQRLKAQHVKAVTLAHYTLLSAFKTPFLKVHSPEKLPGSLPKPTRNVVLEYVKNYDEIEQFYSSFESNYKKRCRPDFRAQNNYIKKLKEEEEKARQYYETLENVYSSIIEESKTKSKERFWGKWKVRLELGNIIVPAIISTIAFLAGHWVAKQEQSPPKQAVQTQSSSSDSTRSTKKSDSVSTKKFTSSILLKGTRKLQRFAKASIHYAVVDMCDWYHQLVHTFQGYLHLAH